MTLSVCLLVYAPDISILQLLALAMAASAGSQFRLYVRNIKYAATKQVSCQHFPVLVLHVLFKSYFLSSPCAQPRRSEQPSRQWGLRTAWTYMVRPSYEKLRSMRSAPAHCSAFLSFANVPCHFHLLVVASMYYYM